MGGRFGHRVFGERPRVEKDGVGQSSFWGLLGSPSIARPTAAEPITLLRFVLRLLAGLAALPHASDRGG